MFVNRASRYNRVKKNQLMHNLFLVHFFNLYMFRAYLGPSSGGTTVCIQQLVLIILFRWLSIVHWTTERSLCFKSKPRCGHPCLIPSWARFDVLGPWWRMPETSADTYQNSRPHNTGDRPELSAIISHVFSP